MRNNKGAALLLVIIVMAVLSILGISLLTVSNAEYQISVMNEKKLQAQNIAKSGADIAAKHYLANPISATETIADTPLGKGSFQVVISKPSTKTMLIQSNGTVDDITQSVSLMLEEVDYNAFFTGIHQTGDSDLDLGALDISHDPGSAVTIQANVSDLSDISLSPSDAADPLIVKAINNTSLPEFTVPNTSGFQTDIDWAAQTDPNLFLGDYHLSSIVKTNKDDIIFDTDGGVQQIVVDILDFSGPQGSITVEGGGEVHLYILDGGAINNPVTVNPSDPAQLFIYVKSGATLEFQSGADVSGYIYAPNATLEIQSAQTIITGAMIGNIIERNGSGNGAHGNFHYSEIADSPIYSAVHIYQKSMYLQ